jgi:hypothetical protein
MCVWLVCRSCERYLIGQGSIHRLYLPAENYSGLLFQLTGCAATVVRHPIVHRKVPLRCTTPGISLKAYWTCTTHRHGVFFLSLLEIGSGSGSTSGSTSGFATCLLVLCFELNWIACFALPRRMSAETGSGLARPAVAIATAAEVAAAAPLLAAVVVTAVPPPRSEQEAGAAPPRKTSPAKRTPRTITQTTTNLQISILTPPFAATTVKAKALASRSPHTALTIAIARARAVVTARLLSVPVGVAPPVPTRSPAATSKRPTANTTGSLSPLATTAAALQVQALTEGLRALAQALVHGVRAATHPLPHRQKTEKRESVGKEKKYVSKTSKERVRKLFVQGKYFIFTLHAFFVSYMAQ